MNAIGKFFESFRYFFLSGGHKIPWWCDRLILLSCEKDVADARDAFSKIRIFMRYTWTLVCSRKSEMNNWIVTITGLLNASDTPLQIREKLYLLAIAHYRNGDYEEGVQVLEHCLEIASDWRPAVILKKVVKNQITKDQVLRTRIAATTVGLVLCGITVAIARKR